MCTPFSDPSHSQIENRVHACAHFKIAVHGIIAKLKYHNFKIKILVKTMYTIKLKSIVLISMV